MPSTPDTGPAPYRRPPASDVVIELLTHVQTHLDAMPAPADLRAFSWVQHSGDLVLHVHGRDAGRDLAAALSLQSLGASLWRGEWEALTVSVLAGSVVPPPQPAASPRLSDQVRGVTR